MIGITGYIGKLDGIHIHRVKYPVNTVDSETGSLLYSIHSINLDSECYNGANRENVECHSYLCNVSHVDGVEVLRYVIDKLKETNKFNHLYLMSIEPYKDKQRAFCSKVRIGIK